MIEAIGLGIGQFLAAILGQSQTIREPVPLVAWQSAKIFDVPTQADPLVEAFLQDYLKAIAAKGIDPQEQGIWIQTEWAYLGDKRSKIPISAASLSKVATTAAALEKWGGDFRFETPIYGRGSLQGSVFQGDLIVEGKGDPLFVWEEAIALGNALNRLGIQKVTGNLVIVGNFAMNFQLDPLVSGHLLQLALDQKKWTPQIEAQFKQLPPATPRPEIAIAGTVQLAPTVPLDAQLLLRHQSLPLVDLIRQMNIYSNNEMAEMLAQSVGGARVVAQTAAAIAQVPPQEIQLVNGSGLSVNNRLSPRAVTRLFMALNAKLAQSSVKITDLFPVVGRDSKGTMQSRSLPPGLAMKTGTLNEVSALAGMLPTKERGLVWFAIINHGQGIEFFRNEQDRLMKRLAKHWQIVPTIPLVKDSDRVYLGDPSRNLLPPG
jgi:D-alanyl-D-alanine carboxypeptidase/D-alanyl-D-alanine-endopeptidase (penicillin-binding protein 4)